MTIKGVLVGIEKNGMAHQKDEWVGKKYEIGVEMSPYALHPTGFFRDVDQKNHSGNYGIRTSQLKSFNYDIPNSTVEVKTNNSTYKFTVYEVE